MPLARRRQQNPYRKRQQRRRQQRRRRRRLRQLRCQSPGSWKWSGDALGARSALDSRCDDVG
eukprot:5000789-Pyramimonas_sp.AAC.1